MLNPVEVAIYLNDPSELNSKLPFEGEVFPWEAVIVLNSESESESFLKTPTLLDIFNVSVRLIKYVSATPAGASFTGFTVTDNVPVVVRVPSLTLKVIESEVVSLPSCV